MKRVGLWSVLALLGCASAPLGVLDASHPASPRAAEAPVPAGFQALGESSADDAAGTPATASDEKADRMLPAVGGPSASQRSRTTHGEHRHDR